MAGATTPVDRWPLEIHKSYSNQEYGTFRYIWVRYKNFSRFVFSDGLHRWCYDVYDASVAHL